MTEMRDQVGSLEENMTGMRDQVGSLEENMRETREQVRNLNGNMGKVMLSVHRMDLRDENEILPRLQNIEACYTSTFVRYKDGVIQIENLQTDVDVLKSVVSDHSLKLKSIS